MLTNCFIIIIIIKRTQIPTITELEYGLATLTYTTKFTKTDIVHKSSKIKTINNTHFIGLSYAQRQRFFHPIIFSIDPLIFQLMMAFITCQKTNETNGFNTEI